jgi:DNA-binding response OmpR family regulator
VSTQKRTEARPALSTRNAHHILIAERAARTRRMMALQLEQVGFAVITSACAHETLALIRRDGLPRLLLLDAGLPEAAGAGLFESLQRQGRAPIVLLFTPAQALRMSEERYPGVKAYWVKPLTFAELTSAVAQLLSDLEGAQLPAGWAMLGAGLCVDFDNQALFVDGNRVALTPTETRLLQVLYANRGRVVSPGYLMSRAWSVDQRGTLGSLWVHIRRLRNKLERTPQSPRYLQTVRGQGYRLHTDVPPCSIN